MSFCVAIIIHFSAVLISYITNYATAYNHVQLQLSIGIEALKVKEKQAITFSAARIFNYITD